MALTGQTCTQAAHGRHNASLMTALPCSRLMAPKRQAPTQTPQPIQTSVEMATVYPFLKLLDGASLEGVTFKIEVALNVSNLGVTSIMVERRPSSSAGQWQRPRPFQAP